jgi:hypothetical protein
MCGHAEFNSTLGLQRKQRQQQWIAESGFRRWIGWRLLLRRRVRLSLNSF